MLADDDRTDLHARWRHIEERFVDDPMAAVREADQVIEQVIDRIRSTLDARRSAMHDRWGALDDATTEQLREILQHYERLFVQLADAPAPDAWHDHRGT
jgi:Na+/phosphate symporter